MRELYLTLRGLSTVIKMTPMGISSIISKTGKREQSKYKKKGINNEEIKLNTDKVNKKTVEINSFIKEHKMCETSFSDIDYVDYLYKTITKDVYEEEFGEYLTPSVLKNIFKLSVNDLKKYKDMGISQMIETGYKGLRGKENRYDTKLMLPYLPDVIEVKNIIPLFYTIKEVTEILNEKHGLSVKKLTINRKIMLLPAIRIRNTIRISKPIFDSMTKEELENILN